MNAYAVWKALVANADVNSVSAIPADGTLGDD